MEAFLPKRVLVTGGAGFIGSHIVDLLLRDDHDVVVVDDLSSGSLDNLPGAVECIRHDLSEPGTTALIERIGPEAIVHAAAQVSIPRSLADPALDARANIISSINVFAAARAARVRSVVYVTSGGALYAEPRDRPYDEDHPIEPVSPYGLSKWIGERYLAMLAPDAHHVVLRLANVFGPRQIVVSEAGVVPAFAVALLGGHPVVIHGDGHQTRDFVYVADVAAAVTRSLRSTRDLTLNIGSGVATSVENLCLIMRDLAGSAVVPTYAPERPGDVRHSVLDSERARRDLGWVAETSLSAGLALTMDWYRERIAGTAAWSAT